MGADYLQKAGKSIKIARDRDLIELVTGTLFTRRLERPASCEMLRLQPMAKVAPGDSVLLERRGDRVVVVAGEQVVGEIEQPMLNLIETIRAVGVVEGRIEKVEESAGVADVEIIE